MVSTTQAGSLAALDLDGHGDPGLHAALDLVGAGQLGPAPDAAAHRHRRREAGLVRAVVDAHRDVAHLEQVGEEGVDQREGEVAVGDRPAERPVLGPLGIDVDPLVVAGGVGERVDPLLGDLQPVGRARDRCRPPSSRSAGRSKTVGIGSRSYGPRKDDP